MALLQALASLVNQRLSAAAEEICETLGTILKVYEDETLSLKQENDRQRRLLDMILQPTVKLHRADSIQLPVWSPRIKEDKDETTTSRFQESPQIEEEQEDITSSLVQEEPESPQIKEEAEPVAIISAQYMETQADVEDCGTSHPTTDDQILSSHSSESDIEYGDDWDDQAGSGLKVAWNGLSPQMMGDEERFNERFQLHEETGQLLSVIDSICPESSTWPHATRIQEAHHGEPDVTHLHNTENHSPERPARQRRPTVWLQDYHLSSQPTTDHQILSSHCSESVIPDNIVDEAADGRTRLITLKTDNARHTGEKSLSVSNKLPHDLKSQKQSHSTRSHTAAKPYCCPDCGKRFIYKGSLKTHVVFHSKRFTCTVCGKGCSQKVKLEEHMRTHTGEKPFVCKFCGKGCSQKGQLKIHMMTHTGEKPFTCSVCGKGCIRNADLKKHMMTHTGEKAYSCTVCGKGFMQGKNLKIHMEKWHKEEKTSC